MNESGHPVENQVEVNAEWLKSFTATARASCVQIAVAADELEKAVGAERFAVIAPLVLQQVIDSSSEMANLMAANLHNRRVAARLQALPRPADPGWVVPGTPAGMPFTDFPSPFDIP